MSLYRYRAPGFQEEQSAQAHLLVDPLCVGLVVSQAVRKPQGNLALRALHSVRAMDDVAANIDSVVSADAAGLCATHSSPLSKQHITRIIICLLYMTVLCMYKK